MGTHFIKKDDLPVIGVVGILIVGFFTAPQVPAAYMDFNAKHGLVTSFIKFAVLATFGESLALRISRGIYFEKGFGLLSRAFVWGVLGLIIKLVFIVFATGSPNFVSYLIDTRSLLTFGDTANRLIFAFGTSLALNMIFSPWLFIVHNITDEHIRRCEGNFKRFFSPIQFKDIIVNLNWAVIWNFSIKKTIPFFWLPAHTLTFYLPPEHRILMAALLSIVLGVALALARSEGANIKGVSTPFLKKLATETKCVAMYGQIRGRQLYHVAQQEIKANLRLSLNPGQSFPVSYGAHGKAILAFAGEAEREHLFSQDNPRFFSNDIKLPVNGNEPASYRQKDEPLDSESLTAELAKVKSEGYAFARSRAFPGINVLCAPVFGNDDKLTGCMLLFGVFSGKNIQTYGKAIKKTAEEMSVKLKK